MSMLFRQDFCLIKHAMKSRKSSIILCYFLFLNCLFTVANAQFGNSGFSCGIDTAQSTVEAYNHLIQENLNLRKARLVSTKYRVAVRATVFDESGSTQNKLTTDDVKLLIAHANLYFSEINVELFLQNNGVNQVSDSKFANFNVNQEVELRSIYDVTNAINLYFFRTISTESGVFLNGSAALPAFSNSSNRIFVSYLDRNKEDFETLKDKVLLHELGHYFGLLHTFHNSNHEDIQKREVVSRDIGLIGNCHKAGDYLCDTPADPFERLVNVSSFNCNQALATNLVDAYGFRYSPPTDNIMSYLIRCGHVFSAGQYQRMEQSFAIRFSPNASYKILESQANYLIINSISADEFCAGASVNVKFTPYGNFNRIDNFVLQISDSSGENFTDLPEARITAQNEFTVQLNNIEKTSSNYRFRVRSKVPYLESTMSEQFTVHTAGKLELSLAENIIRPGGTSKLVLNFDGSGPWQVVFDNGVTLSAVNDRNHQIQVKPDATTTYRVVSAVGICGSVPITNTQTLTIAEPALLIKPDFEKKSCQETFFQLPVSGLNSVNTSRYFLKLTSVDTTFILPTSVGSGVIFAQAPRYFQTRTNEYQLTIEGTLPEDFSLPVAFTVYPNAPLPTTESSNLAYCFNTNAKPLEANGTQLKWYYGQTDLIARQQIIPITKQVGVFYYYVTQTNEFGCESARKPVKVVVKQPATAEISGDNVIKFGDKTALAVRLRGDAPWNFELSDGQRFETTETEFFPEVQPAESKVYTLSKALDECGEVFITGSAKITVLQPLSIKSEFIEEISAFPNPADEELNIVLRQLNMNNKSTIFRIVDMLGRTVVEKQVNSYNSDRQLILSVNQLPTGTYLLYIQTEKQSFSKRISVYHE